MRSRRSHGRSAIRSADRRNAAALALLVSLVLLVPAVASAKRGRGADGRFEKRESSHFVLFQDVDIDDSGGLRGSRRFEQQVLAELERAYDRLDDFIGLRPRQRIEVYVYDAELFDQRFTGRFRFQLAGFFNGAIHIRGATRLTVELGRVLHHELVHAAFHEAAPSLVLPAWLNEGVAEWFEARSVSKRHLSRWELDVLARAHHAGAWLDLQYLTGPNLIGFGPDAARLGYLQSYGMVERIARVHGEQALRDVCRDVVRSRDVERTLVRNLRRGTPQLVAELRAELD